MSRLAWSLLAMAATVPAIGCYATVVVERADEDAASDDVATDATMDDATVADASLADGSPDDALPPAETAADVTLVDTSIDGAATGDGNMTSDTASSDAGCEVSGAATATRVPIDVVIAVDQSASMSGEMPSVNAGMGELGTALDALGADYHVVVIAQQTSPTLTVCPGAPLTTTGCVPTSRVRFVDQYAPSEGAFRAVLTTLDAPAGTTKAWRDFLRDDAFKGMVFVTDADSPSYSGTGFDAELLAKPGAPFGTTGARRYVATPICGANYDLAATKCPTSVSASPQLVTLAKLTGGRWYPSCAADMAPHFTSMAQEIVKAASCDRIVPPPPGGGAVDPSAITATMIRGDGKRELLARVAGCDASGWMMDGSNRIRLCGAACTNAKADAAASVEVSFGCGTAPSGGDAGTSVCSVLPAIDCSRADVHTMTGDVGSYHYVVGYDNAQVRIFATESSTSRTSPDGMGLRFTLTSASGSDWDLTVHASQLAGTDAGGVTCTELGTSSATTSPERVLVSWPQRASSFGGSGPSDDTRVLVAEIRSKTAVCGARWDLAIQGGARIDDVIGTPDASTSPDTSDAGP